MTSERVAGNSTDSSEICNCGVSIVFLHDVHMRNLYSMNTWHKCRYSSRGAGRGVGVRRVTGRIRSLDMNFSIQLSEKTFGPRRVHVLKDIESGVQGAEFFRNPNADGRCVDTAERPVRGRWRRCPLNRQDTSGNVHGARTQESSHQGTRRTYANSFRTTLPCQPRKSVRTRHHPEPKRLRMTKQCS